MNNLKPLITFALLAISTTASAVNFRVLGTVADSTGTGEIYASIRIFAANDTIKPVAVGVTDDNGNFSHELSASGQYRLNIHSVGKKTLNKSFSVSEQKPIANMDTLIINNTNILDEVEVVAQRPLVSREIDRIGYDVQADEESKTSTVIEMLCKVPLVSVDSDNKITVRGSSNFKIYKNGRPNNTYSNNPKEVLASIPASMIKRIEVITEPGAKYDAEGVGAIINIVTIDNVTTKGVLGNISLRSNTINFVPRPSIWATSQIDKVTFSLNTGYSYMNSRETRHFNENTFNYNESGATLKSSSQGNNPGGLMYISAEASYEPDTLNLFTFEFGGYYYDVNPTGSGWAAMSDANGNLLYSYNQRYNYPSYSYFDFNGNLNYQRLTKRKGETFTLSYMISTTNQNSEQHTEYYDIVNPPFAYSETHSDFDLSFIEHTFQVDYVRPFKKIHQIDIGAKYILRNNNSVTNQKYVGAYSSMTDFSHITNIAAAYADYRINIGKWSARAGLRYEYSYLKAKHKDGSNTDFSRNLSDWVPSASVAWRLNDINSFTLNYAARINRPGISYLDPTVSENPNSTSQGNPTLESAQHNSIKLSYMFIKPKINFNLSAGYEFSTNEISQYSYVKDNHQFYLYGNVGEHQALSFNGYAQWNITSKTSFMLNAFASRKRYKNSALGDHLSRWELQWYSQITQQLPWKLRLNLSGYWSGKYLSNAYYYGETTKGALNYTLSLQRAFLKSDRLSVRLAVTNPIGPSTGEYQSRIINGDRTGLTRSTTYNRRIVQFTLSYRFGSLNAQVKKVSKSIQNDDLMGRKK